MAKPKQELITQILKEINLEIQELTQGYISVNSSESTYSFFLNFNGSTVSYNVIELPINIDPHFIKQKVISQLKKQLEGNKK